MALEFNKLNFSEIVRLAKDTNSEEKLYAMTFDELNVLNERLEKIALEFQDDSSLVAKLIRLKSYSSLIADYLTYSLR